MVLFVDNHLYHIYGLHVGSPKGLAEIMMTGDILIYVGGKEESWVE